MGAGGATPPSEAEAQTRRLARQLAQGVDRLNGIVGRALAWLLIVLALVQFALVVARYVFAAQSILWLPTLWWQELTIYLFGAGALLGLGHALALGAHVRIDVLYGAIGPRAQAAVDLIGALFLLAPLTALIVWASWPSVATSWSVLEGSSETSGIPLKFLLKSVIPTAAALLALQGFAQALRAGLALTAAPVAR